MAIIRGIVATLAVVALLTACDNPFAPDDTGSPRDPDSSDDNDEQQGFAPAPPGVYFI